MVIANLLLTLFLSTTVFAGYSSDIELSLRPVSGNDVNNPQLELALTNSSDKDVSLNLGMMLANGKVQLPTNLRADFLDGNGNRRIFHFFDMRYAAIGGRVDDYIIPLRSGSTYTLRFSLNQFNCADTGEFGMTLTPGKNHITIELEGSGAKFLNGDTSGLRLLNFWLGKARSNTIVIEK